MGLISASDQDPRLLLKKVLVHALAHLDIDRWEPGRPPDSHATTVRYSAVHCMRCSAVQCGRGGVLLGPPSVSGLLF